VRCTPRLQAAMAWISVLPEAVPEGELSAEAVRKRDFQGPMRERQEARQVSPAVWIVVRRRAQAALIAWMSGCTPRTAIIRFRL
jgi:hypothetical protein